MSGEGTVAVGGETAAIQAGDAIPIQLGEVHSSRTLTPSRWSS